MKRILSYSDSIREALHLGLDHNSKVMLIGQGVPDASQTYGTTKDLVSRFGVNRVMEMPLAEASMVGIMLGSALVGMRPVMTFARLEFAMLAMDQIVNQAAKWHYMFGGQSNVPMVLRMIVGRGWGQGAQHSQSLHNWFAHIPGLKVVMPTTAYDAKGMLLASIEDNNPVIFIEHRWLHYTTSNVPEGYYTVPLGQPKRIEEGEHATIVASSYSTIEALKAARLLAKDNIHVDIIDLRTLSPLNDEIILESIKKTGRLIVCDQGSLTGGFAAEIVARVTEKSFRDLKEPPVRITLPDCPTPTTRSLSNYFYPLPEHIANAVRISLNMPANDPYSNVKAGDYLDVPDSTFKGPF